MMGKSCKNNRLAVGKFAGKLPITFGPPARSRRTERRRLLALQRKAAKLNRSIDRLTNSIGGSENAGA